MLAFSFAINWIALGLAVGIACLTYLVSFLFPNRSPIVAFSFLKGFPFQSKGRTQWIFFPLKLCHFAFLCFLIAFVDPYFTVPQNQFSSSKHDASKARENLPPPTEGIAIYLVLDQSGSMNKEITVRSQTGYRQTIRKIDLLKQVTEQFIQTQASNLIGLVTYARIPHVLVPLTLDHQTIKEHIQNIGVVKNREEDGTSMGYAIFKTAHLIAATKHFGQELREQGTPAYDIKGAAIIVVTDGLQDPNPLDKGNRLRTIELDDAALYAKNQNIHLYIINIDPSFASSQFDPHRRQMVEITDLTGGKFYLSSESQSLESIYKEIDRLEKGVIATGDIQTSNEPKNVRRLSLYPFFIALGLTNLLGFILLETTFLRHAP